MPSPQEQAYYLGRQLFFEKCGAQQWFTKGAGLGEMVNEVSPRLKEFVSRVRARTPTESYVAKLLREGKFGRQLGVFPNPIGAGRGTALLPFFDSTGKVHHL